MRTLGLDDDVAVEKVGAGFAAGLVDHQAGSGVRYVASGEVENGRSVEQGVGCVGLQVGVGTAQ
jgi:hypothetical protein